MLQKFRLLCGLFRNEKFIYAIKFGRHPWHYFDPNHRIFSEHNSLPAELEEHITTFTKVRSVEISLDEDQSKQYYDNGKFIFKNTELKTFKKSKNSTTVQNTTRHLIFNSLETNPLSFLKEFEKCTDLKTDRDKLWKIRDFVDKEHQAEFSQLRITGDWSTAKRVFVEKYLTSFIENKKREINTDFYQANSLRNFVDQKFSSLETYTSLTFTHQLEVVMNSLPVEVSYLLMVNEVFSRTKYEILDFCDSIQEVCEKYKKDKASDQMDLDDQDVVFNLRGEYDFLETMSDTSQSTWSSRNSSQPLWSTQQ